MADEDRPYIGYRSAGRRPERNNDREAARVAPLAALRGALSGVLGAPGDIEALIRMLPGLSEQTVLPTSDDVEKRLPGRAVSESPTGRAFTGAGQLAGGFYTGPGSPLRAVAAVPGAVKHGATEFLRAAGVPSSNVVKNKGGNWLNGAVDDTLQSFRRSNTPVISGEIINNAAGRDLFSEYRAANQADPTVGLHDWMRKNYPDVYARIQDPVDAAANRWIDTKLAKYVRNEMATKDDPVRALAERGVLHYDPPTIYANSPAERAVIAARERTRNRITGEGESDLARAWEMNSDYAIEPRTAQDLLAGANKAPHWESLLTTEQRLAENPWLAKLKPDDIVHDTRYDALQFGDNLGIDHLVDELKNAMRADSGLPAQLRIDPKDIDKITMPQAVQRVHDINVWRAEDAARAERAGMLENLRGAPRLADEGLELSFVEKPGGTWVDIPETVDQKGMRFCNSIGKAGGWCTKDAWAAETYGSGENRLTALVDAEGRPHAQAKLTSVPSSGNIMDDIDDVMQVLTPAEQRKFNRYLGSDEFAGEQDEALGWLRANMPKAHERFLASLPATPPNITELKPVGNTFNSDRAKEYIRRDPDYKAKVTDSVLKFLNSGEWGSVNDLHHYGIVDLRNPDNLLANLTQMYDEPARIVAPAFNAAVEASPQAPRFMTVQELRKFIGPIEDAKGYAEGGAVVRQQHAEYEPATIAALAAALGEEL